MLDLHDEDVHMIKQGPGRTEVEKQGAMSDRCALSKDSRRHQLGLALFTRIGVKAGITSLSSRSTRSMYRNPFQYDLIYPRLYQPWIEYR